VIDPVFRNSPQYACEPLSERLGVTTILKVECVNPIRSFKGRGTDYLLHRLELPAAGLVENNAELTFWFHKVTTIKPSISGV